jgi:hypothetical protein
VGALNATDDARTVDRDLPWCHRNDGYAVLGEDAVGSDGGFPVERAGVVTPGVDLHRQTHVVEPAVGSR